MWNVIYLLDAQTEPQVFELDEQTELVVALDDEEIDLSAFVVETPEGEVILDDLVAEVHKKMMGTAKIGEAKFVYNMSQDAPPAESVCVTVMGIRVCAQ